jgi:archaellum component FlaC
MKSQLKCMSNDKRIADLEGQLSKVQAEANEWKAFYFEALAKIERLKATIERMRPVVEAAMERHSDTHFDGWLGRACSDYEAKMQK